MVAASRRDDAFCLWVLALEPAHEGQAAAYLEGPRRGVILVLDPHRATQPFSQQGPGVLGGGGHDFV
ncbi:hypothetical protein D3C84_1113290 [compost metagenome]